MGCVEARMRRMWARESGATAVEYGIMVALIAVAILVAVQTLGVSTSGVFGQSKDGLDGIVSTSPGPGDDGGSGGGNSPGDDDRPDDPGCETKKNGKCTKK
jgi:pilus assembly protein Flp/PilA